MSCGSFGFTPPKLVEEEELYVCDGCKMVGEACDFELADKEGQLCEECVLESF